MAVTITANNENDHFVICGKNLASNKPDDYLVGSVNGNNGDTLVRTINDNFIGALSVDQSNNILFTQPNNTTSVSIYPKCMVYANERCMIRIKCKVTNSGQTSGATFRPYIVVADPITGKVVSRANGQAVEATANGAIIEYNRLVPKNTVAMCFFYCNSPIAQAETTFSELVVNLNPLDFDDSNIVYEAYNGSSIDGSGTLLSIEGMNYIMALSESFEAKFKVNYREV